MPDFTSFSDDALIALDNLADKAGNLFSPTLRFGVTGLSRAGKTVFITALVHNLIHGGRLPMFSAQASGRISKAQVKPQPNMALPRFQYEDHIKTLLDERDWPQSTRAISQLRLTLNYESASFLSRRLGSGKLNIDIVDYPGEWLLDLPLLGLSYRQWSKQAISLSKLANRKPLAADWHTLLAEANPAGEADEMKAVAIAQAFTHYLRACRNDTTALSTLPPGRFLMPGDLEGSPALTFAPLDLDDEKADPGYETLFAMMEERYEAYKTIVVKPFFREHFARLDRQIVLVDALQAINAGPEAVADLELALSDILTCFRPGNGSWLSSILSRRIDRILFAATKADHLHHENHTALQSLLERLVQKAITRARLASCDVEVAVMAAVRATREGELDQDGEKLPVIIGTPQAGEKLGDTVFNGNQETAIFPGDLPTNPEILLGADATPLDLQFVRFQPPPLQRTAEGITLSLPHIRLDRALDFLFGDWLA